VSNTADDAALPFLSVQDLTVRYRTGSTGVAHMSLRVDRGETVALIGPNGAGKTSTLRAIAGFLPHERVRITRGEIRLDGRVITGRRPSKNSLDGIVLVPERNKVFRELNLREHVRLAGNHRTARHAAADVDFVIEHFPALASQATKPAWQLSGGQRQMLCIGTALVARPQVLLIDELSQGLAPGVVSNLEGSIKAIADAGMTIVLVEQNTLVAERLASRLYVLDAGRLVASGSAAELRQGEALSKAFLGTRESGTGEPL
jgi:branched-chain amino acid transport system ATP-binding protein